MRRAWFAVAWPLVVFLGVAAAQTGGVHIPGTEERECLALLARLQTSRVLNAVQLTPEQKAAVMGLARQRVAELDVIEQAKAASEPAVLEAMRELRRVVLATSGVPDEVKARVRQAEAPYKQLWERLEEADEPRATQVWTLLSAEQRAAVIPWGKDEVAQARPSRRAAAAVTRQFLSPAALEVLEGGAATRVERYQAPPELRGVVADIRVMNLVNTLYLSAEQARAITGLIGRAEAERAALEGRLAEQARQALPKLRQLAAIGGPRSPRDYRAAAAFARQRAGLLKEARAMNDRHLDELKKVLTPNQVSMVANFVPCTVPVKSLTHPERVGQVADNTGLERSLDRLRQMPERFVPRVTGRLEQTVTTHFKRRRYEEAEIQKVVGRVPEVVKAARSMEEAEYKLKRSELAERLAVPPRIAEGAELDRRMVAYLLSPNLAALLQPRSAQAK